MKLTLVLALALAAAATAPAQTVYDIDSSHSAAQFSVRHLMISNLKGEFTKVSGSFAYDPKNPSAAKVEAVIDANTISTRETKRDAHLKSPDFFDTAKYPTLSFKSKQVWKDAAGLKAKGDLTIHGVTREVVLNIDTVTPETKDPWGNVRVGATATTKISRKDFGLTWNQILESGGAMVGDEVTITLDVEGVKRAAASAGASN